MGLACVRGVGPPTAHEGALVRPPHTHAHTTDTCTQARTRMHTRTHAHTHTHTHTRTHTFRHDGGTRPRTCPETVLPPARVLCVLCVCVLCVVCVCVSE